MSTDRDKPPPPKAALDSGGDDELNGAADDPTAVRDESSMTNAGLSELESRHRRCRLPALSRPPPRPRRPPRQDRGPSPPRSPRKACRAGARRSGWRRDLRPRCLTEAPTAQAPLWTPGAPPYQAKQTTWDHPLPALPTPAPRQGSCTPSGRRLHNPAFSSYPQPSSSTRRLHRYELSIKLGEGGMGTVYLARAEGLAGFERLVAVKCCHKHLLHDGDFVAMFLDEARIAARINHPNVVATLDVNQTEGVLYMVMDYVEGVVLDDLIRLCREQNELIPIGVALRVSRDALQGLHAAHELTEPDGTPLNLVHRDVSPRNIIVGADGIARIMDFGVAKADARLANTKHGLLKGTLAYMAPEQVRGRGISRRTDVFAMGVVLWETLVGKRLFRGNGPDVIALKITRAIVQPPTWFREDVPMEVSTTTLRALAQEPDDRTPTALAVAEELEASGHLATQREVAAFVERIAAEQLRVRREAKVAIFRRRGAAKEVPEGVEEPTETLSLPATFLSESTTRRLAPAPQPTEVSVDDEESTARAPRGEIEASIQQMTASTETGPIPDPDLDDAPTTLMTDPPVDIELVLPEQPLPGESTFSRADTVRVPDRAPMAASEPPGDPAEQQAMGRTRELKHQRDVQALRRRPIPWVLLFVFVIAAVVVALGYVLAL